MIYNISILKKSKFTLCLTVLFILTLLLFAPSIYLENKQIGIEYEVVNAQFLFGGTVTPIIYCTCSNFWLVFIGPPVSGLFYYIEGVQGYQNFNMPFATYALGIYDPIPMACLMVIPYGCMSIAAPIGQIGYMTGSSM